VWLFRYLWSIRGGKIYTPFMTEFNCERRNELNEFFRPAFNWFEREYFSFCFFILGARFTRRILIASNPFARPSISTNVRIVIGRIQAFVRNKCYYIKLFENLSRSPKYQFVIMCLHKPSTRMLMIFVFVYFKRWFLS